MPAGENTKYNQQTLHRAFGCTALLLLISTVWMFADDHRRQWKSYQRQNRTIETRLTEWKRDAQRTKDLEAELHQLHVELSDELGSAPDEEAFAQFVALLKPKDQDRYGERLSNLYESFGENKDANKSVRATLVSLMEKIVKRAKDLETKLSGQRKFAAAVYDKVRADYDIGVRDSVGEERLAELRAIVDEQREKRDALTLERQAQTEYRIALNAELTQMLAQETDLRKQLDDANADFERLAAAVTERKVNLGKRFLELPIFDAFGGPLKPENWWTKGISRPNGSFAEVTRFDRCVSCHQNMEKTAPGSAVKPAYEHQHEITLTLTLPSEEPIVEEGDSEPTLLSVYGFELAGKGLVNPNDVTVRNVVAGSLAVKAPVIESEYGVESESIGLQPGDVIAFIDTDEIHSPQDVHQILLRDANWGSVVTLRVIRGLPHPFSTHPRLDLYVGSLSPHKYANFGCSICHEGQGSATNFTWASHTPNSPEQAEQWSDEYGWFNNHHWIYPMYPTRFVESSCLKCHHDVVELGPSERFPEASAPKVVHGYNLIRQYGCFGCHEIHGYKGADQIGPDLRLEPNYFAAAAQVKADEKFGELPSDIRDYVEELIQHPEQDVIRHRLAEFLKADSQTEESVLSEKSHKMVSVLDDVDFPGELRKVGPSLRYVGSKLGKQFLYDWIRNPKNFRESTKMPKFFGLWDHLQSDPAALELAKRYEPVEILGITQYLLSSSQEFETSTSEVAGEDWTNSEMIERGKLAFETKGCLACHQHADFPGAENNQGPNLTGIGDKFAVSDTPDAKAWLYTWLKSPTKYHARTKMPNLFLDPVELADGTVTDPAADIAAYLLSSTKGWAPPEENSDKLTVNTEDLKALVLEHLKTKMFYREAEAAIAGGEISVSVRSTLKGAEAELAAGPLTTDTMLHYVGEKSISKYGCYACHDIPGFEDAKPIGAALAEWGRKDASKLAFEHIAEYLHHGHGHGHGHNAVGHQAADHDDSDAASSHSDDDEGHDSDVAAHRDSESDFDESFYIEKILEHDRTGFIWQKLKEPRSYDFEKASNKDSYNDRLRMPLFPFTNEEREAVITFVLGLVAEPPQPQFVYSPDPRSQALIAGQKALDKYNCAGCHMLEPQKWTVTAEPGALEIPEIDRANSYPFMLPSYTSEEIAESAQPDNARGTITGSFHGMPRIDSATGKFQIFDEDGIPIEEEDLDDPELDPDTFLYQFEIWKPSLFDGRTAEVGATIEIPTSMITTKQSEVGGDLTLLLIPRVTELEKAVNTGADGRQAWGWLPPPLIEQGTKVQTDWMHNFLLEPYPIRPATFMRMPKFNMSSQEATDLVNYFAARDGANYPYDHSPRTDSTRVERLQEEYSESLEGADERPDGSNRFDHAMNIVTSTDYCVQCHIVGSFEPKTSDRAKAPNLAGVEKRLRPEYLRRWIANPKQLLPYTPMPVNVKYPDGVANTLYHGTAVEQLDALVDLLMNYSRYTESKANVSELVKPATADGSTGASE